MPLSSFQTIRALFLVKMNDDLCVGIRAELVPSAFQVLPKFSKVVNLTIEGNPD